MQRVIPSKEKVARDKAKEPANSLSVDDARAALVSLVGSLAPNSFAATTLDALKKSKPRILEGGSVAIGPWECDMSKKRFTLIFASGDMFHAYGGRFEKDNKGRWRAILESEAQS